MTDESKEERLHRLEQNLVAMSAEMSVDKAGLLLDIATLKLDFQQQKDAWEQAWLAFNYYKEQERWELAVVACDIMVAADQPDSLKALAHGVWLGVTFPIDPEVTVAILQHLIDESPPGSDTQAVAAVCARYIVAVRKPEGMAGQNLEFLTDQRLAEVASRHRSIKSQQEFDIWLTGNEFDNPDSFLPKLSQALDELANHDWWLDRTSIRNALDT